MRPRQFASVCAAVSALAAHHAAATVRGAYDPAVARSDACPGACVATGRSGAPWRADTTVTAASARRRSARRRGRVSRSQPRPQDARRDTVTVVRVDTVRVHDTVTVERPLPAPPQRVDTVRLVEPRGRRP